MAASISVQTWSMAARLAGQAGPPQFFQGRPDHRFLEGAHIRLGMDDGEIDQRPGITARETIPGPRVMGVALVSRHNPVSFSPPSTRSQAHPRAAAGCLPSLAGGKRKEQLSWKA